MVRPAMLLLLCLALGCSRTADPARFIPAEADARTALETALESWRTNGTRGQVPDAVSPTLHLIDSQVPANKRPSSFVILGAAPGDGPRVYTVKLTFEQPSAESKARYVIFGLDPVWIMRQEDFDMMTHWEHKHH